MMVDQPLAADAVVGQQYASRQTRRRPGPAIHGEKCVKLMPMSVLLPPLPAAYCVLFSDRCGRPCQMTKWPPCSPAAATTL
jgi:hypothetical protein